MNDKFRKLVKQRLKDLDINQEVLAERLSMTPSQVSRIISGDRGTTMDNLLAMADAIKVDRREFLSVAAGLPSDPNKDPWVEDMTQQLAHVTSNSREYIRDFVLGILRREDTNGSSKPRKTAKNER